MNDSLGLLAAAGALAQCPCGGGGERRISYWAVLVPAAVCLLGAGVFEIWMRTRVKKPPESEDEERQRDRCSDE